MQLGVVWPSSTPDRPLVSSKTWSSDEKKKENFIHFFFRFDAYRTNQLMTQNDDDDDDTNHVHTVVHSLERDWVMMESYSCCSSWAIINPFSLFSSLLFYYNTARRLMMCDDALCWCRPSYVRGGTVWNINDHRLHGSVKGEERRGKGGKDHRKKRKKSSSNIMCNENKARNSWDGAARDASSQQLAALGARHLYCNPQCLVVEWESERERDGGESFIAAQLWIGCISIFITHIREREGERGCVRTKRKGHISWLEHQHSRSFSHSHPSRQGRLLSPW